MELIEDGLEVALDDFLARRLFCVLAQRSGDGPRLSPLWFLWEDGAVWNVTGETPTGVSGSSTPLTPSFPLAFADDSARTLA